MRSLEKFRTLPRGVLVATDVAARGLDIQGIDHVVHYQLPRQPDIYVHRSGRTARAKAEGMCLRCAVSLSSRLAGLSITLLTPEDVPNYTRIVRELRHGQSLLRYVLVLTPARRRSARLPGRAQVHARLRACVPCHALPHRMQPSRSACHWQRGLRSCRVARPLSANTTNGGGCCDNEPRRHTPSQGHQGGRGDGHHARRV